MSRVDQMDIYQYSMNTYFGYGYNSGYDWSDTMPIYQWAV